MKTWLILWLVASVVEGASMLTINRFICDNKLVRRTIWLIVLLLSITSMVFLLQANWQLFAGVVFVQAYRIINIARILKWRLQRRRLQNSALRAFIWLFVLQLLLLGLTSLVLHHVSMSYFLYSVLAIDIIILLGLLKTTVDTWNYTRPSNQEDYLSDKDLPSLSVLVPARNETTELEQCLQSIVASDYPKLEVIVLDDCSVTKRTPEIIREFAHKGVRFVSGNKAGDRWLPKNWAYERLSQEANGEILLFCGVDTRFETVTLRTLVSHFVLGKRRMISLMPQRIVTDKARFSILQPMRYFWELCLPRRLFKRPPVLSTCWMIDSKFLEQSGSFEAVANSVSPEAHFARQAVTSNSYSFLRSNRYLPLFSAKSHDAQYQTTLRVRYPQLHRRVELVAITALFELLCFIVPFAGLVYAVSKVDYVLLALSVLAILLVTALYVIVSVKTGLCKLIYGIASTPVAFLVDIVVLHVSCLQYEFGSVTWKGRNVCLPVMQVIPRMPSVEPETASDQPKVA